MVVLSGGLAVLALLLVHAGLVKLVRPDGVRAALEAAGLPSARPAPQLVGVVEIAVGAAALASGHAVPAVALGLLYGAFALFSVRQRGRGAGCGCFGEPTAEVSRTHIALDVVGAAVGLAAAAGAAPAPLQLATDGPLVAGLALLLTITAVGAVQLLVSALPDLASAVAGGDR